MTESHTTAAADRDTITVDFTHGRAWTDQGAGVRIGYAIARPSGRNAPTDATRTVLLVHGAPQTRHAWRKVIVPLAEAGYQVVAPDYRVARTTYLTT